MLGRLEKGLPPDQYEKVRQLIAAEDDEVEQPQQSLQRLPQS